MERSAAKVNQQLGSFHTATMTSRLCFQLRKEATSTQEALQFPTCFKDHVEDLAVKAQLRDGVHLGSRVLLLLIIFLLCHAQARPLKTDGESGSAQLGLHRMLCFCILWAATSGSHTLPMRSNC